jgi:membrane fusion protein, multidrug efflux system
LSSRTSLALLLLVLLGIAGCRSSAPEKAKGHAGAAPPPVPVTVAAVTRQDVPIFLTGLGTVQAYNTVTLKTRIDGQIMAVYFREGQDVHKGQVLALIDPRPYEVALQTAKANLARDQAQLNTAKANLARSKALLDAGVIALQEYQTQEATAGQFEGTVKADQAAIENAQLNLTYTRIVSPIEGRVGLRMIDAGNMVHASDTSGMLVITQMRPIAAIFTLPQEQLPDVLAHSRKGKLNVQAYSSDDRSVLATGQLETVDNQIDPATGTAKLKAVFDNRDGGLWHNQFVNIHLQLATAKDALVIPAAAVQRGPDGNLAYVMKDDHKIAIQPVTVAMTQRNIAVVSSGLREGEQVVTEGQDKLRAGSLVSPKMAPRTEAPQSAGTPQSSSPGDLHPNTPKSGAPGTPLQNARPAPAASSSNSNSTTNSTTLGGSAASGAAAPPPAGARGSVSPGARPSPAPSRAAENLGGTQ